MKALLNYSAHAHEWPHKIKIPPATMEIISGVRTRTPGVMVVSDALAAELQGHSIARAWFGPAGVVVESVGELS